MRTQTIASRQTMIKTHLFLLCPNNSGSTYLSRALGTSPNVWSLPHEGQHMLGFAGPSTMQTPWPLIWAGTEQSLAYFRDSADYDWERTKKAWYFHASAQRHDAPVFHTKSPPFLSIADQLDANFADPRFLIMVRNPYAALEGIIRRRSRSELYQDPGDLARIAARHLVNCLAMQADNVVRLENRAIHFSYEYLCAHPDEVAERISALVPEIGELDLTQRLAVKGDYDEPLRNMNEEQIARLNPAVRDCASEIFQQHEDVLSFFNYPVLKPQGR